MSIVKKRKILFVGVFDQSYKSTNNSQIVKFKNLGHEVVGYNFREKAKHYGLENRDSQLINIIEERGFDLIIFSKGDNISDRVFTAAKKHSVSCLWFMDPLVSYNSEMRHKTSLVEYFFCDKENVLEQALRINKKCFLVCEGYDEDMDMSYNLKKKNDVSFIGSIYGDRANIINNISHKVRLFTNVYGSNHAKVVNETKINLNFCTSQGASDRVYKVLASGGFLISDDWIGRSKSFKDGEDIVIFKDCEDLNSKINFYLNNEKERNRIAKNGSAAVRHLNRTNWAKNILRYTIGL